MRSSRVLIALSMAAAGPALALAAAPELSGDSGNIVVTENGVRRELTRSGRDAEPVLAPDGKSVVFTRKGRPSTDRDAAEECASGEAADELRRIGLDGAGETVLVRGRADEEPRAQLCEFNGKQFSSDGSRLYFLSPAWVTSAAVHVLDMKSGRARYVMPGNDLVVLNSCKGEHRDRLIVQQHRYFQFGGSYDWWWLFEPDGKEIGPVGEHQSGTAVLEVLNDSGQCE